MMEKIQNKDLRRYIKSLVRSGWGITNSKAGYLLYAPGGNGCLAVHGTPSDWRTLANIRSIAARLAT